MALVRVALVRAEDGTAVLSVADDGPGIPLEEQEKIFDRFYRGDAARTVPGTGLGLSMVRQIAELHGAAVSLESRPGAGSVFSVRFPTPADFSSSSNVPMLK